MLSGQNEQDYDSIVKLIPAKTLSNLHNDMENMFLNEVSDYNKRSHCKKCKCI